MTSLIEMPWPPRALSPNSRLHWAKKLKIRQSHVRECWAVWNQTKWKPQTPNLEITFHPPSRRRFDLDNALSSCKAMIDILSNSWKMDDSTFTYTLKKGPPVKNGKVVIREV